MTDYLKKKIRKILIKISLILLPTISFFIAISSGRNRKDIKEELKVKKKEILKKEEEIEKKDKEKKEVEKKVDDQLKQTKKVIKDNLDNREERIKKAKEFFSDL